MGESMTRVTPRRTLGARRPRQDLRGASLQGWRARGRCSMLAPMSRSNPWRTLLEIAAIVALVLFAQRFVLPRLGIGT